MEVSPEVVGRYEIRIPPKKDTDGETVDFCEKNKPLYILQFDSLTESNRGL